MVEDESLVELMSVAQGLRDDMFLDDSFPRISVFVKICVLTDMFIYHAMSVYLPQF